MWLTTLMATMTSGILRLRRVHLEDPQVSFSKKQRLIILCRQESLKVEFIIYIICYHL